MRMLDEDTGHLAAGGQHVVGPFELSRPGEMAVEHLDERQGGNETEFGRAGREQRRSEQDGEVKVTGRAEPGAAMAASAGGLGVG